MNYNPSPREEFCKDSKNVTEHHEVVECDNLRRSINVALLEYQRRTAMLTTPDIGSCASCHLKMQGVHEFVTLFYNLCETSESPPRPSSMNLTGNVRPLPKTEKK